MTFWSSSSPLSNPELNIHRVSLRVQQGGHNVPDADVRRRYERSLANAAEALLLANDGVVFDNSGLRRRRMLEIRKWSNHLARKAGTRVGRRLGAPKSPGQQTRTASATRGLDGSSFDRSGNGSTCLKPVLPAGEPETYLP
jgi:hypothetical protein